MRCRPWLLAASSALFAQLSSAQTYSICNPLDRSCPADPALGGSTSISLKSGPSSDFTPTGDTVSYNSAGAQLTVAASGNNPTLTSKWYIMFGHVDFVFKAAPGVGMVSSAILISDDLDEIDWEVLGDNASQAQSNFFGKGVTGTYNRGAFSAAPNTQSQFNTYSIDWTAERIEWQINGATVRTVTYDQADGQYPQTPMQVKIGAWAGGDPSNSPGTIEWAGGPINYSDGPFVMQVQSIAVTDYSTGSAYQYSGTDGTWQEVKAIGGSVHSSGTPGTTSPSSGDSGDSGDSGSSSSGSNSEATATRTTWPWVSKTGTASLETNSLPASSYNSGSHPSKSSITSSPSPSDSATGVCETISAYNQQGFPITMTVPAGYKPSYNNQGALMPAPRCTASAAADAPTTTPAAAPSTLATQTVKPQNTSNSPAPYVPGNGASHATIPFLVGVALSVLSVFVAVF